MIDTRAAHKYFRRFLLLGGILLFSSCGGNLKVYDLRCEGLVEPLGIDSPNPHFSWKIESRTPTSQTAYEIEVGPDDLWHSGKVSSPDQVMVPYGGKPLTSRTQAWWRVRVWNADGKASPWSSRQRFGIGIVKDSIGEDSLGGEYIGASGGEGRSPKVRTIFDLPKTGETAFLYVNSLGYHEAYLNGEKLSDAVLSPAVSQLDKRSQIVVYEVGDLLRQGGNELLLWLGSGWYKPTTFGAAYDGPLVKAELTIDGETVVETDGNWEGCYSGYRDLGTWQPHRFNGERIEAGVEPTWGPVDVVKVDGILASMQMCPPCVVDYGWEISNWKDLGGGSWLLDAGTVLNGMLSIDLPSLPKGHTTKVSYSDFKDDVFDLGICGWDELVSSGNPAGDHFENKFNHHVFRYIRLDSLPQPPRKVVVSRLGTGSHTSYFDCSDSDMDIIENLVHETVNSLAFDGYMVDCASIERLGYGGDGNASTQTLQTMQDAGPLFLNWLQAWADSQREDGGLPHTAPNPYTAGGGPYWCSFLVQAAYRTWMNYADPRPMERFYPNMKRWIDYVDAYSVDGLLQPWPNTSYRGWYLGDWAAPRGVDVTDPSSVGLVANCTLCQSYLALEQIALALGRKDDATSFAERYKDLREKIHAAFFHPETCTYASGSQLDMTYPLLVGAVPSDLKDQVVATLKERTETIYNGHLSTGLVGVPIITEWAVREGEVDWIYGMLKKKDYPGYLYMHRQGGTGVWEEWDGGRSHLHNCYNGIGSWFYQALGGIVALEPGYRKVGINPCMPSNMDFLHVEQETPYGQIYVWVEDREAEIGIPTGITAIIMGEEYGSGIHKITL